MNDFCCTVLLLLLQYVVEKDANTLLPQFLGLYRITVNNSETHLVVMRCVFSPLFSIHCKYDLKARQMQCCIYLSLYRLYKELQFVVKRTECQMQYNHVLSNLVAATGHTLKQ